jgi:hypothetical protein
MASGSRERSTMPWWPRERRRFAAISYSPPLDIIRQKCFDSVVRMRSMTCAWEGSSWNMALNFASAAS